MLLLYLRNKSPASTELPPGRVVLCFQWGAIVGASYLTFFSFIGSYNPEMHHAVKGELEKHTCNPMFQMPCDWFLRRFPFFDQLIGSKHIAWLLLSTIKQTSILSIHADPIIFKGGGTPLTHIGLPKVVHKLIPSSTFCPHRAHTIKF